MIKISRARRGGAAIVAATVIALVPALAASAHVTVSSPDASPGGFGKLVLRVPSESATANTTAVSVHLPAETPFRFVSVGAIPGWTAETVKTPLDEPIEVEGFTVTEAVTTVTWTAYDDGLAPEEFAEFALSVGPFPDGVDQLVFPATQTYSDGEVVSWADPSVVGQPEPEHPAPVLILAVSDANGDSTDSGDTSDTLARVLGIVGIAFGAIGIAFVLSARRTPKSAA
jgi:uncharacterized protein YcnI